MNDGPHTYDEANAFLGNKASRKIGNNTYLERLDNDRIGARLHSTYVAIFRSDGITTMYMGGYDTPTTRRRLNRFAPARCTISRENGVTMIHTASSVAKGPLDFPFYEGVKVAAW